MIKRPRDCSVEHVVCFIIMCYLLFLNNLYIKTVYHCLNSCRELFSTERPKTWLPTQPKIFSSVESYSWSWMFASSWNKRSSVRIVDFTPILCIHQRNANPILFRASSLHSQPYPEISLRRRGQETSRCQRQQVEYVEGFPHSVCRRWRGGFSGMIFPLDEEFHSWESRAGMELFVGEVVEWCI